MNKYNKYYTPNIEEFTEDFRFQINSYRPWDSRDVVNKKDWDFSYIEFLGVYFSKVKKSINNYNIRVKYLDQQDIEELGWVRDKEDDRMYHISFELGECSLHFSEEDEDIVITSLHPKVKNFDKVIFHGKIKNYNELKKLMKQLEINK